LSLSFKSAWLSTCGKESEIEKLLLLLRREAVVVDFAMPKNSLFQVLAMTPQGVMLKDSIYIR